MPAARYGAAAVTAPDGNIYVIGGFNRMARIVATVKMYDPRTNTWTTKASMPTARWFLAGALGRDGKIYAIGGSMDTGSNSLSTVEVYDPSQGTWSSAPSLQVARHGLGAASLGGKIYAVGGTSHSVSLDAVEYLPSRPFPSHRLDKHLS
jgi:N-acetylneuraminic acid mutarotase